MLYLIANKVALWIFDDKDNKKENVELCKYGLELFISSFFCSIVLIAFGFVTTSIIESIIFIVAFSALRIYTGGYHANSYSLCTLITVAIYALILFVYRRFTFAVQSNIVSLFVFSFSLIIIFLFSPVRNQHKKIDKNQYKAIKIKAVVVLVIEYINYPKTVISSSTNCKAVILGDVSLDATVSISDATLIQLYCADMQTFSNEQELAADVNRDGTININDVTKLQRIIAGLE